MKIIVGLGNPGDKYKYNRHNAGFLLLDNIVDETLWKQKADFNAIIAEVGEGENKVIFVKPQTFMNLSGDAVSKVANFYKVDAENVLVIHDEVDIKFGSLRVKHGGGSAGHKGVQSVMDHIGEDFERIRVGVRNELTDIVETDKFVLANFTKEEYNKLNTRITEEVKSLI